MKGNVKKTKEEEFAKELEDEELDEDEDFLDDDFDE